MRALFYIGDAAWTSSARVFLAAARGLAARGHQVAMVCGAGTPLVERVAGNGVETVLVDSSANVARAAWELRRVLHERFIEVVFVHSDRDHLIVSSAMRATERGAVIRRVPPFTSLDGITALSTRIAASGLLVSTEAERAAAPTRGWKIPAAVAPLGVDLASSDPSPVSRAALGVPPGATVIVCPYDASSVARLATVMRTLAALGGRERNLHAVVIGPGARDEALQIHAASLKVGSLMTYVDDLDDSNVMPVADLVWIAATGDRAGFGFLDAMAHRLPVVAERTRLSECFVADGITGTLVPTNDVMMITSALTSLLAYPDRRASMGRAGRGRVQREFTEGAMVDGFERAAMGAGDRTQWAVRS